jgi:uncharacterized membrane protein
MQNPPPVQVSSQPPATVAKSSTGLDENLAALLSYVFGWISGLIFFLMEKDSRLVRFHSMQSILLGAAAIVIFIVFWIVAVVSSLVVGYISGILGGIVWIVMMLVGGVIGLGIFVAAIISLIKAYQGQFFKLPVIGNYAEKFSTK